MRSIRNTGSDRARAEPDRPRNNGERRASGRSNVLVAMIAVTIPLLLAACSSSGSNGAHSSTTTSTLPPLPPSVIAYVALAGSGSNVGNGSTLVEVTLSPPPRSVSSPIHVGVFPDAVAITPNGRIALVANYSSNTVTAISLPSNRVLAPIHAGAGPAGIAIAPNGKKAYVTDANANTVTPINLATLKPGRAIHVGDGPQGIAITPNGSRAYVADAGAIVSGQSGSIGHDVTPIDLATGRAGAPIRVGNAPLGIAVSPDGSTVFVTNLNSESVTPISVASGSAGAAIATAGAPQAVAIARGSAWVVNAPAGGQGNNLQPISLAGDVAGKPIKLPSGAANLAIAPNGATAWVVCLNADKLVPVDLATHRAGTAIRVRGGPFAVAVATEARGSAPSATTTTVGTSKKKKKSKS